MQPLEIKGEIFIEVTLKLWPSSYSGCLCLYIIYMYIHVWHSLSIHHLISLSTAESPHSQILEGGEEVNLQGEFYPPSFSDNPRAHQHRSKFQASNSKKLQVIWRQILASFIQSLEGWSSKFHVSSSSQCGIIVGDGMNNCERLLSECQGWRCFSARVSLEL